MTTPAGVRVPISTSWLRVIMFCSKVMPHGEISLKVVSGSPTNILNARRDIRVDRPDDFLPFMVDLIEDGTRGPVL